MKKLSIDEYTKLCMNSKVLMGDNHGDKVFLLSDQSILKLFRIKRLISSSLLVSPEQRFANNVKKIQKLNIPTVSIIDIYNIKAIARTAVHYHPLEGETVRDCMQSGCTTDEFLDGLGKFFAVLHEKGIFFRSAHFGNIIYTNNNEFGLIDISDMQVSNKPLGVIKRLRNMKHIFRVKEDIHLLNGSDRVEQAYLQSCGIKNKYFIQKLLNTVASLKAKFN